MRLGAWWLASWLASLVATLDAFHGIRVTLLGRVDTIINEVSIDIGLFVVGVETIILAILETVVVVLWRRVSNSLKHRSAKEPRLNKEEHLPDASVHLDPR